MKFSLVEEKKILTQTHTCTHAGPQIISFCNGHLPIGKDIILMYPFQYHLFILKFRISLISLWK